MTRLPFALVALAVAWFSILSSMHAHPHPVADEMSAAARAWLESLDERQRAEATVAFETGDREDWHFVPRRRGGLALKEMNEAQRRLAFALVRSALSARGFEKVQAIVTLESVLREIEGGGIFSHRDPERYHLLVAGTPEAHGTWGWRFEGHHLSLNITAVRGEAFAVTPSFLGANPAEVPRGPRRGERILAEEEDLGRALVRSLDARQRAVAIVSTRAPSDILTGAARRVEPLSPPGIAYAALEAEQQAALVRLIEVYVERHRAELAKADMQKIRAAGLEKVHFAWAGGLERGEGHYYRVQGPTFLLEYDNTQNDANHIHTVWRDFEGDFGRDLLREHLEHDHGARE
ncbi:DUF3500 domain-containing protein [Opitutales bacterium ASA1]|uniref:DUF3500 domain-containing protein n=1 Tax=Congregicoccus parvus TaxID=3081749 RepID=UPI002B3203B6|nr:DUF3500 domain-containing protein [Opitutales bacterium ASA1]